VAADLRDWRGKSQARRCPQAGSFDLAGLARIPDALLRLPVCGLIMCTLSFLPDRQGYTVAMNRDEQRTRIPASPAGEHDFQDHSQVYPQEPSGGTWIGADSSGNLPAILNWYSVDTRGLGAKQKSRGDIIPALLHAQDAQNTDRALSAMQLAGIHPFRLVGIFPGEQQVHEWRWDGCALAKQSSDWILSHWFSSSKSDRQAESQRGKVFAQKWGKGQNDGAQWLRAIHARHIPEPGAFSACVHREDAATVSYTEVSYQPGGLVMSYQSGNPCQAVGAPAQVRIPALTSYGRKFS